MRASENNITEEADLSNLVRSFQVTEGAEYDEAVWTIDIE